MMRADAERNRAHIVDVARQLFKEQGLDAPLDEVAKRAKVGSGTLYRHFPTRQDLHAAVMQSWIDSVVERTDAVLSYHNDARGQLRHWLSEYTALLRTHRGAAAAITASIGDDGSPLKSKCSAYLEATARVLAELRRTGELKPGVDALQVCRLVGSVAALADTASWTAADTAPLLETIADGLIVA